MERGAVSVSPSNVSGELFLIKRGCAHTLSNSFTLPPCVLCRYVDLDLTRVEAERVIQEVAENGTFLFRASTGSANGLSYTITFRACDAVHNYRVKLIDGQLFVNDAAFDSIGHLVVRRGWRWAVLAGG